MKLIELNMDKLVDARIFSERGGRATVAFRGDSLTVNVPAGKWVPIKF